MYDDLRLPKSGAYLLSENIKSLSVIPECSDFPRRENTGKLMLGHDCVEGTRGDTKIPRIAITERRVMPRACSCEPP